MIKELDGKTPEQALDYLGRKNILDAEDRGFIHARRDMLSPEKYQALMGHTPDQFGTAQAKTEPKPEVADQGEAAGESAEETSQSSEVETPKPKTTGKKVKK